jgi:hypothetical protein
MENNINTRNILTRDEQTQIRLALVSSITQLEKMLAISKQYNLDCTIPEQQLANNKNALQKLRGASNVILLM